MSHYSVSVIIPKEFKEDKLHTVLSESLEPFDESLGIQEYVAYTKADLEDMYKSYIEKSDTEDIVLESYEEYTKRFHTRGIDEDGNALSAYNPDAKWDWYVVGGRWDKCIETKDGKKVNYARIKDIVFEKEFTDEQLCKIEENYLDLINNGNFFKPEYYQRKYPTFEMYLKSHNFSTYALLDRDGEWIEPGEMGWFGMSSATPEEETKFQDKYMQLIEKSDPEDWLIVVDCHI